MCRILMLPLWCNLLPCCLCALLCFSHRLSMFSHSVPQDTFKVYALEHKFLVPQLNELKGVSWYQRKEEILSLVIIVWPPHHAWDHPLFSNPQFWHNFLNTWLKQMMAILQPFTIKCRMHNGKMFCIITWKWCDLIPLKSPSF